MSIIDTLINLSEDSRRMRNPGYVKKLEYVQEKYKNEIKSLEKFDDRVNLSSLAMGVFGGIGAGVANFIYTSESFFAVLVSPVGAIYFGGLTKLVGDGIFKIKAHKLYKKIKDETGLKFRMTSL